jgi:tRNA threonylcarbamoyladenosine biosynthesis protein TsaE
VKIAATTKSVEDTRAMASEVAPLAGPGDLIVLSGDLGAGKTAFVQGFARGLGVTEPVASPAFVLVRSYQGRLPIAHVDVYRLDHIQELVDLGIAELLDEGAVTLVEWGDVVSPALPSDYLEIRLDQGQSDDERRVTFSPVGASWPPRWTALNRAVDRWVGGEPGARGVRQSGESGARAARPSGESGNPGPC